jgi:serine/threonine-protein kinase
MGEVYLGRITGAHGFERRVVIKVMRADRAANERYAMMFIDEACIAAQLQHPNIVQTLDFGVADGDVYLVTEYVAGCDLRSVVAARPPISYAHALRIVVELASGLAAAHDACDTSNAPLHIVHRDVTPSNVLLGIHGEVKLADFGIAKARSRSYETVSGTIKGKAPYMAPEQLRGEQVDRRADLYALGVLLYELTTGTRVTAGSTDLPDPRARRSEYPEELVAIVQRAVASDRDARYATAGELIDDLDVVMRTRGWSRSLASLGAYVRTLARVEAAA